MIVKTDTMQEITAEPAKCSTGFNSKNNAYNKNNSGFSLPGYGNWLRVMNMDAMTSCCCGSTYRSSKSKKLNKSPRKTTGNRRLSGDNNSEQNPDMENSFREESSGAHIPNTALATTTCFGEREEHELRETFDMFDTNNDGKISCSELSSVVRLLRFDICDKDIQDMIKIVDKNENGVVDYDEYISLMQRFSLNSKDEKLNSGNKDDKTFEAFRVFDLDGNGYIDRNELRVVMNRLGENVSEEDVRAMFQEADLNEDGKIDYSEFSQILLHLP